MIESVFSFFFSQSGRMSDGVFFFSFDGKVRVLFLPLFPPSLEREEGYQFDFVPLLFFKSLRRGFFFLFSSSERWR